MGFAEEFLGDLDPRRWTAQEGAPASLTPTLYFLGNGEHALGSCPRGWCKSASVLSSTLTVSLAQAVMARGASLVSGSGAVAV